MMIERLQSFNKTINPTEATQATDKLGLTLKLNIIRHFWLLGLCLILFFSTPLSAKKPHFLFDNIPVEQGLTSNWIMKVLTDQQGFIWVGSQHGLFRYDGYHFKRFRNNPEDPSSLAGNYINTLFQDSQGVLWVGLERDGFAQYHPETESFTNYRHEPDNKNSLSHDAVFAISEAQDGDLWLATFRGGLNRFNRRNNTFTRFRHDPQNPGSLSDDKIYTLLQDSQGVLWLGTRSGGLNRFDKETATFKRYQHDPDDPASLSHNRVYSLFEDAGGTLWVGTRGGGLNRFDRQTESFQHYRHDPDNPESLSSDQVWDIFEDQAGALWIGTLKGGLNLFDKVNQRFSRYQYDPQNKRTLPDNDVFSITQDQNGLLWLGTFGKGVCKFDPASKRFGLTMHDPNNPNSLSYGVVRGIVKGKNGILWIGTESGLNRYNPETDQFHYYRHEPDNPRSINDNYITAVFEDSAGTLWVGTLSGLNQLNQQSNSFVRFQNKPDNADSLSDNYVVGIHQDSLGNIWIATRDGLNRFNPQLRNFTRYRHSSADVTSISHDVISSLYSARDGSLWIGTEGGLNKFNVETQTFERYRHDPGNPNSLSNNMVYSLSEDPQGNLWLGTDSGLNKFNPKSKAFTHYREKDGLVSNRVSMVMTDKNGNLWLNSGGITMFNPESGELISHIGAEARCLGGTNRHFQATDGQMFFGYEGYCAFYPEDAIQKSPPPTIVLTDFRLLNKTVPIGDAKAKSPLTQTINHTRSITLSHRDNVLSFEFAALHYSDPKKNQYKYKLEGFNQDWIETGADNRRATYTNLAAGDYTFRVKASNHQGVWNEQGRDIKLRILPAPWRTWWAYTIYALVLATLVLVFVRIQGKKVLSERAKKTAEAANQAKSEFLTNMSHELRTPLNAVLGFSEILSEKESDPKKKDFTDRINLAGSALLSLINSVLDLAKIEAGKLELEFAPTSIQKLFAEMESIFIGTLAQKDVAFHKQVAPSVPEYLLLDPHRLRDALMNFCSNACKFTSEGEVTLRAEAIHNESHGTIDLKLHITDTGKGIAKADFERIFKPFEQSQGQKFNEYGGTGLGLSITRQFIELMNGHIDVQSKLGFGSHFTVTLKNIEIVESANVEETHAKLDFNLVTFAPAKILLADDITYNREVIISFLEHWPFTITQATNGIEALKCCESEDFDIILLDIKMPEMDGYETSERLRSQAKTASIPIIAVTSSVLKQNVSKVLAHCDMYLAKPLTKAALVKALMNYLEYRQEEAKPLSASLVQTESSHHQPNVFSRLTAQQRQELSHLLTIGHLGKLEQFVAKLPDDLVETTQFLTEKINQFNFDNIQQALKAYEETVAVQGSKKKQFNRRDSGGQP